MKQGGGDDHMALAWEYDDQVLEVIPAKFSLVKHICALDVNCGAILDTWTGITGTNITDLIAGTSHFIKQTNFSTRLTSTLEIPTHSGDNYGSRIKGWLRPPVTGLFNFSIAADDLGEFWLSTDSDPANKERVCYTPGPVSRYNFTAYSEQKSKPLQLDAGHAYYFEVREFGIFTGLKKLHLILLYKSFSWNLPLQNN
jgi:hypothetical protein